MDTFDTSEEVMSEIDIQETEVDFGQNFEFGINDNERENNNENEAGIDGENGEKNIEDEKLEEKEETLSWFISANRGGSEEFKLEYEGTFVLSTLTEEQKSAQADLLTSLSANPEQAMMLPDHIDGKTTYFTAAKMDSEGNLKYEIRSYTEKEEEKEEKPVDKVDGLKVEEATLNLNLELNIDIDKQEKVDKETLQEQSLLTEIEAVNEEEVEQVQGISQIEEQSFTIPEASSVQVEQEVQEIVSMEVTQSEPISIEQNMNAENTNNEQIVIETREDKERAITEKILELLIDEPQEKFIEEVNTVTNLAETTQDTQEHFEPLVIVVDDRIEKAVIVEAETTERNGILEEVKVKEEVVEKAQGSDVVIEAVANIPQEVSKTEPILSEVVNETHVAEVKEIKSESSIAQEVVVNNIQAQSIEKIETAPNVVNSDKNETQNTRSVSIETTNKDEKIDQHKESSVVTKGEEKIVVETKEKDINLNTRKVDSTKPEKFILNNEKDTRIVNTRESKIVLKEATPKKVQVPNAKTEKEAKSNVLPFRERESKANLRNVEVQAIKPVVEKTNSKEPQRLQNIDGEKAVAGNQEKGILKVVKEAIVLTINTNKVNNTARSEAPISLEKPKEEQRTREEGVKDKPLSGHDILLQILGISQNVTEIRNAEPTKSRSVSNINQEDQETKSPKSIPSMYQQRNLNGITLKIAA